jgi:toxin ParE1/3/4
MTKVIRSPKAVTDMQGIAEHIAADNPTAAYAWLESIESLFRTLATQPMMGERYQTRRWGLLRRFCHGNYVVYYRPINDGVDVLRVIHGARDPRKQLD